MKVVAETAATTATIVVSGKTIASAIDSGVEALRELGRGYDVAEPEGRIDESAEDLRQAQRMASPAEEHREEEAMTAQAGQPQRVRQAAAPVVEASEEMPVAEPDVAEDAPWAEPAALQETEPMMGGMEPDIRVLGTEPVDEGLTAWNMQDEAVVPEDAGPEDEMMAQMSEEPVPEPEVTDDFYGIMDAGGHYDMVMPDGDLLAGDVTEGQENLQDMSSGMDDIIL